jgi:hypothetical protein
MADPKIQLRRGTDTERTDGTLGTPSSGEPCYTTDTKALFIGDGSTAGGVPATTPASLLYLASTTSQNINALASDNLVTWNIRSPYWGVDLTHSISTDPHKITIETAGVYEISATIACEPGSGATPTRWNGIARIRLNNSSNIGPQGKGGYLRMLSGHDETSLHITPFAYEFAANDYIWLKVDREATTTAQVDTTARASGLYIKRLR